MFRTILVHYQEQLYKLYITFGICRYHTSGCCVAIATQEPEVWYRHIPAYTKCDVQLITNCLLGYSVSYVGLLVRSEMGGKNVFITPDQRKLIFSYITLLTVQNYLNRSVYILPSVSEENYEVAFAGGGSKHKGGSYEMMPYSNVQYHEAL